MRTALFVFPLLLAVWRLGQCILIAAPSDASCVWVYVKATAVGSVLVGLAVGLPEWGDRRFVRRADLLPDGLRVATYRGSPVALRWEEVIEVREFRKTAFGGQRFRYTRVTVPSARDVIFVDQLTGYDELVGIIRENTPQARRDGSLRFVERWLMGAKPV